MKKTLFFSIVFVATLMFLAAFSASAATVSIGTVQVSGTTVTIPYTVNGAVASDQSTILVYNATGNAAPSESNIVYIDQFSSSTAGPLVFTMKDGATNNTQYTVLMGGTNVASAASATFAYGTITTPSSYTVKGTTNYFYPTKAGDPLVGTGKLPNEATRGFKINLKTANQATILKTATIALVSGNTAEYTFADVAPGTYIVQIYRVGCIVRNFQVVVGNEASSTFTIPYKPLFAGDVDTTGTITGADTASLFASYGYDVQDYPNQYNVKADFDLDGNITGADTAVAFSTYGKNAEEDYNEPNVPNPYDKVIN